MNTAITSKNNHIFSFRLLTASDNDSLGVFFNNLSTNTRSKYGPHPLTKEYALQLCNKIGQDNVVRFIIEGQGNIVGYFILDFNCFSDEVVRYKKQGIDIDSTIDPVLAPCIADDHQNSGLASQAMALIIDYAKANKVRRIVLMGGTQAPNSLAIAFYKKFNFEEYSQFYTEDNQLNNIDMMLAL